MTLTLDAPVVASDVSFDSLRARLTGSVHTPDEPEYDALVSPWNLAVPMRPAAVVAVRTAEDVAEAVRFAGAHGFTAGVQATGHGAERSLAGHLLVMTRGLDEVTVHPEGWARVGAGVKWSQLVPVAAAYGLAGVNGSTTDVGIVGYTTGGGVGPLARTYGINADRVRAFEVVTGDGVFRRVTPTEYPDLYFALRGGKGAAGIVTALEFDLIHMPTFYGGAVYFDGADAAEVIDRWRGWADDLPEQGTTSFVIFQLPPLPEIPPPLAGRMSLGIRFLWTGEPEEGARLLNQIRAVAPVILDDANLRPYTEIDHVHADPVDPMPVVDPAILLNGFPAEAAEKLLAVAGYGSGSPQVLVEVRHLGGAYAREGAHPSAFSHRAAKFSVLTVAMAADEEMAAGGLAHADQVFTALADWDTGGVWPNFGIPHDAVSARRCYDEATLARLREVTATYDPQGVLQAGAYTRA
ncbi:FAD-binding oxidoreductase [Blastococcus sp. CT_GayMR19]|uniref:FAD-binding oxidoreductase n=1 Tax=Blastococcus sp. CT_GayMR19 TaxID=2559608 RepID=UPI0010748A5D|nr:FAD-binding protein [Blastococcus sp. CT_GayMR19]TFV79473.1 FAD-binding oxidoreductase [Blastococcus sp. CT_GayMR19]